MEKFTETFHCKLFDKEAILDWGLPEEVRKQLGIDEFEYFFLTSTKEALPQPVLVKKKTNVFSEFFSQSLKT